MKKISLAALMVLGAVSFANADFLSISAGAGYEQQNIDGYAKIGDTINYFGKKDVNPAQNPNVGYLGLKDKNNLYVWAKLIHPIPLIPNVKLQYTKYDTDGYSKYVAGNVKIFGDFTIPTALTNAHTTQTINSYDLTFFYEFKPLVADIEVGFGFDYWDGHTKIYGTEKNTGVKVTAVDNDWSVILPYLYGHVESMQFFGFSALVDLKWAKAGDNHHYDYSGAVKYTIDIPGPINPFVKLGYRYKEAYGVDGDNETKLKYKGAFLEIGAKF
jgi:outer membrane protein